MKKIKYLAIAAAMIFGMATANAQGGMDKTFCFLDADGNEVKDGSTVTFYAEKEYKIPEMPNLGYTLEAKFDLKVKNTAADVMGVGAHVVTKNMSSGSLQFCFPSNCFTVPADYVTGQNFMASNAVLPLNSEWLPKEGTYGEADFTVQLMVYDYYKNAAGFDAYDFLGYGPKVNIHCVYADPTGITDVEDDMNATEVARYDANGRMLTVPQKGLNIIKLSNGKTIKTVIK